MRSGIETPLTAAYAERVLALTGAATVADAGRLVALDPPDPDGGADGLG
jgi:hypothetical protein